MADTESGEMPFLEHIHELRQLLILSAAGLAVCTALCFLWHDLIIGFLSQPFDQLQRAFGHHENAQFVMSSILEGFMVKIKVAFYSGVILSFPLHVYGMLRFIFPGLTQTEKRVIVWFLIISTVLALTGSYFAYVYLLPITVSFLSGSAFVPDHVEFLLNYHKSIFYVFQILLITLLVFQFPVVLELLLMFNILTRKFLLNSSRYFIVGIFVLSAVVTPPDFISQLFIAVPLVVLYFLAIMVAKILGFGEMS